MLTHVIRTARAGLPVLLALQFIAAGPASAARFEFDQKRTEVRFYYTMALVTHLGRFTRVSGTLDYDDALPGKTRFSGTIATASLTTGLPIIDEELKSPSFFNVKASPIIAFKSRGVHAADMEAAEVTGDITVNGITRPVTLQVKLKPHDPGGGHEAGARKFIATTRIQRSAFNMTDWPLMVADEIDIEIDAVLRPKT